MIIIAENREIIIKDVNGNTLFEWYPKTNKVTAKEYINKQNNSKGER